MYDYERIEEMLNEGTLDREICEELGIDFDAATNNYPDDDEDDAVTLAEIISMERREFIRSQIRPYIWT